MDASACHDETQEVTVTGLRDTPLAYDGDGVSEGHCLIRSVREKDRGGVGSMQQATTSARMWDATLVIVIYPLRQVAIRGPRQMGFLEMRAQAWASCACSVRLSL